MVFLANRLKPIIFFLFDIGHGSGEAFGGKINWTILWAIGSIVPTLPLCYNVTIICLTILQNSKILFLHFCTIFFNFLNVLFWAFILTFILKGRLISFPHKLFIFLEDMPQHNKIAMYALDFILRAAERLHWRFVESELTFECHPSPALYFINHLYYIDERQPESPKRGKRDKEIAEQQRNRYPLSWVLIPKITNIRCEARDKTKTHRRALE